MQEATRYCTFDQLANADLEEILSAGVENVDVQTLQKQAAQQFRQFEYVLS